MRPWAACPRWSARGCPNLGMTQEPKLIALDLGERRIGLAVSGPGNIALPAGHIVRSKLAADVQEVIRSAEEHQAQGVVFGIPYMLHGETGESAKLAHGFIRALRKETTLAIHEMDERFTSVEAEALLRESGVQPSRDRASVDETAAMLILQRFLASRES